MAPFLHDTLMMRTLTYSLPAPKRDGASRIKFVLALIVIFNLLDAIFTLLAVASGWATEENPLMDLLLAYSPVQFMVIKLTLVSLGIMLLWRLRDRRVALVSGLGALGVYGLIVSYHLQFFARLAVS
jgi:hypothetical protein